ncbi:hypothetical protein ABT024_07155 [Streptomyces sp. NPDC002812]|uniref:hypothetical protein n=1 Tax=Streptomyces sp. NPDC002812 TaxID=3154434 RepID=UPI0033318F48
MTGPEHYRKAEQQLRFALDAGTDAAAATHCAIAQVHATLALAAATAVAAPVQQEPDSGMPAVDATAWYAAAGQRYKGGEAR